MNSIFAQEFATDLPCSGCILAGYVYYYGTQARSDITDPVDGYCCRENPDGTLYCGDEMDKVFDEVIDAVTAVTSTRTEKVRLAYLDLVARGGDQKTTAQELYISLYSALETFKDDSDAAALE